MNPRTMKHRTLTSAGIVAVGLAALLPSPRAESAAGDAARGKELAAFWCAACHGKDGNSPSAAFPILAGQHESYLLQALQSYRNGTRADAVMAGTIRTLTSQQLEDVAAWFASQRGLGKPGAGKGAGAGQEGTRIEGVVLALPQAVSPPQSPLEEQACVALAAAAGSVGDTDTDGDGLADRADAAPQDPAEFVRDVDGDGRFEICSIEQFQAIQTLGTGDKKATPLTLIERLARRYELVRDLDGAGFTGYRPIGSCGPENSCMAVRDKFGFAGFFDGQGYAIRGLVVAQPAQMGVGLFGVVAKSGSVGNIDVVNADVRGMGGVGLMVGVNFGTLFRCQASGKASGNRGIGGLMGANAGGMFDCQVRADVSGEDVVGGAIGDSIGVSWHSSALGRVTGKNGVGGFAAVNSQRARIVESYATGSVTGVKNVGGFVGFNTDAIIANSYAVGTVTASSLNAGGLVGFNSQSEVRNSYAKARVQGTDAVGLLVGRNTKSTILQGYATGTAAGEANVGGLVGDNSEGTVVRGLVDRKPDELRAASAASTGWLAAELRGSSPDLVYCDADGSGAIEAREQVPANFIWDFGAADEYPAVRCTPGGVVQQHRSL